jgi:hypothetical protein
MVGNGDTTTMTGADGRLVTSMIRARILAQVDRTEAREVQRSSGCACSVRGKLIVDEVVAYWLFSALSTP